MFCEATLCCTQSTFKGRLRHFLDVVDPRTLLTSEVGVCTLAEQSVLLARLGILVNIAIYSGVILGGEGGAH